MNESSVSMSMLSMRSCVSELRLWSGARGVSSFSPSIMITSHMPIPLNNNTFFSLSSSSSSIIPNRTTSSFIIRCEVASAQLSTSSEDEEEEEEEGKVGKRVKVKIPLKVYHIPKVEEVDLKGMEGEIKQYVSLWKGKKISANYPYKVQFVTDIEGRTLKFFAHLKEDEFLFL